VKPHSNSRQFWRLLLPLFLIAAGLLGNWDAVILAAEKLEAEQVAALAPQLFKLHLSQHEMDTPFTKRLLKEFVNQLDTGKNFFLKGEAEAAFNLGDEELTKLSARSMEGDFSHYRKLLKGFLDTQINRDDALYTGLENRADEIKAKAAEEEEDEAKQIKWTERPATEADREKRVIKMAAEFYKVNKAYLSDVEAMKMALQTVREEREKWKKIKVEDEVGKLYLKSFMLALDPHTEYFDADDEEEFAERLERSFAGIGVQIRPCPLGAQIEDIIKGGPSEKSGKFSRGDQIVAVDSVSLAGLPINKIVRKIKGEKGTEVKLTVLKRESKQTEIVAIKRDTIVLADMRVKGKKIETAAGPVGIISVQAFYVGVHTDVRDRIKELSKEKPLAGVILDLRFNAGGYLEEAVGLAGLFIDSGPVVGERDGAGRIHWNDDTDHEVSYSGPLVVLTNQFSASASEIVAGALKDYGRALVVAPTQTFGKGTVQRVIPLAGLNLPGEVKITTHQYFLAGGESVQLKGVEPDVVIPGPKLLEDDGMLERATENAVPWNKIKGKLDKNRNDVKAWTNWKTKSLALLQENSKKRVEANPELKDLSDPKKKPKETKATPSQLRPDEAPPLVDEKKDVKDLQAEEAAAVIQDMVNASFPAMDKHAASK
jgi:carboxyl-terminal processing protease